LRFSRAAAACALVLLSGCELAKINLPVRASSVVVHGVLSANATQQTVLVERTLTGAVAAPLVYDYTSSEPILTDGGVPEIAAATSITTPTGQVVAGRELQSFSSQGNGAGTYIFPIAGSSLVPGGKYQLRIVTKAGEVVTAETVVPDARPVTTGPTVDYNRVDETFTMEWAHVPNARGFMVRIESPYVPWITFTDSLHVALTGSLRSLAAETLPHVFLPGFRQIVTVSAIDANMYDYYRTGNNAFTGSGTLSRVKGGLGVFGSVVTIARRTLNVVASPREPIEGTFDLLLGSLGYYYGGVGDARVLSLYVESPAARSDQLTALTAGYRTNGGFMGGAVGTLSKNQLKVAFLSNQQLRDTIDVFTAELRGDTLDGTFSKGAPAKYVRRR
jgi:hypothetical protein